MSSLPPTNLIGDESELKFMVAALQHGLGVAKPYSGSIPYDVIIDNGRTLHRVQIKATSREDGTKRAGRYSLTVRFGTNGYSLKQTDFIAAHIQPIDVWYIIPVEELGPIKKISLRPQADNITRFAKYEEAWHLLQ